MDEDKKKLDEVYKYESKMRNNIWNEAIEKAATMLQLSYPDNSNTNAFCAAIRSMKK